MTGTATAVAPESLVVAPATAGRVRLAGALLATFVALWVVIDLLAAHTGVPPIELVWVRYGAHLVLMIVLLGPRHGLGLVRTRHLGLNVLRSLLMLGMPVCFIGAVTRMPASLALAVFWIAPLLLLAGSALVLRERPRVRDVAACALGFAGAVLVLQPRGGLHRAVIFPLGMAACFALYQLATRAATNDSQVTKLFHTALWVFLALSVVVPFQWQRPTMGGFLAMVAVGALGAVGLYALDVALEFASPVTFAAVAFLQPLAAMIVEMLARRAAPVPAALAGAVLVAAAAASCFVPRRLRPAGA